MDLANGRSWLGRRINVRMVRFGPNSCLKPGSVFPSLSSSARGSNYCGGVSSESFFPLV